MSSEYSVETRHPYGRSSTFSIAESPLMASTTLMGSDVAFEYCSSPRLTTSALASSTQSWPVTPRSNRP